jgi:hypothetical protein
LNWGFVGLLLGLQRRDWRLGRCGGTGRIATRGDGAPSSTAPGSGAEMTGDSFDSADISQELKFASEEPIENESSRPPPSVPDQLETLARLRDQGVLTDEEFKSQKQLVLSRSLDERNTSIHATSQEQPEQSIPHPVQASGSRRKRRFIGLIVVALLIAAGITAFFLISGSSPITAHGTMEVDDFQGDCLLDSGFSDITDGTQVVATSPSGAVVGTGSLSYDSSLSNALSKLQPGLSKCIYHFSVNVPGGLSRYGITVSHRGTVWVSPSQMAKGPGLSVSSGGSGGF